MFRDTQEIVEVHLFLEQPLFPNICVVRFHRFPIDDVEVKDDFLVPPQCTTNEERLVVHINLQPFLRVFDCIDILTVSGLTLLTLNVCEGRFP